MPYIVTKIHEQAHGLLNWHSSKVFCNRHSLLPIFHVETPSRVRKLGGQWLIYVHLRLSSQTFWLNTSAWRSIGTCLEHFHF